MPVRDAALMESLGTVLRLIREGHATTRRALVEQTGLSRDHVGQRLAMLMELALVVDQPGVNPTRGRPAGELLFTGGTRVVLAIDVGFHVTALAVWGLDGRVLAERKGPTIGNAGPGRLLAWACAELDEMLSTIDRGRADVVCVGVGLPGPVDVASGRLASARLAPGWVDFPIAEALVAHFDAETVVDSDVNVIACGEAQHQEPDERLLVVNLGSAFGVAYTTQRTIQGAPGCDGDIGHIRTPGHDEVLCRCGKHGCLQTVAGEAEMTHQLTAAGIACSRTADIAALALAGVPQALTLIRQAGNAIGFVIATVLTVLNPTRLIVGGDLSLAGNHLLGPLRETIYREASIHATSDLEISRAYAAERAGLVGAGTMAIEHALAPARLLRHADVKIRR